MSPAKALRRSGAALLLAVSCLGLSCSSSDPSTPVQDPIGNTYLRATITILDTGLPCTGFSCEPEFYECRGREPIAAGQQWIVLANSVTAGSVSDTQWVVTGTDTVRKTSIALEMSVIAPPGPPAPPAPPVGYRFTYDATANDSSATYADIDTECDEVGAGGPESRLHLVRGNTSSSLTMTQLNWFGTSFIPAQPDGQGGYSPESIAEGTFSFIGQVFQATPTGALTGEALIEGCYRVNLPRPERGVPATPSPSSPACN